METKLLPGGLARAGAAVVTLILYAAAALAGPLNPGFEADNIGQPPAQPWQWEAADAAVVVGSEGAAQFPVYADEGITINPYLGEKMVRLGTPKQISESQDNGLNRVYQTFPSTSETLSFSFYALSYDHRGDDRIVIDVTDQLGNSLGPFGVQEKNQADLTIWNPPRGAPESCSSTPCELTIDVGKRKDFLNTGWLIVEITGLPTDGSMITLSIGIQPDNNQALGTWGYVDNTNTPPEALFSCTPNSENGNINAEGDLTFCDARDSNDPDGDEITYRWTASGGGLDETLSFDGPPIAAFAFPNGQSSASVFLTVTDTAGAQSQEASTTLQVSDAPPLVNAVNVIGIDGQMVEVFCRFADPGADDTHNMAVDIPDLSISEDIELFEENTAPFSSGYGSVMVGPVAKADAPYSGTCTVYTSNESVSGSDAFTIDVLTESEIAALEDNDVSDVTGAGSGVPAPAKAADTSYVMRIDNEFDSADVVQITRADTLPLKFGDTIAVTIKGIAEADLDGALLIATQDSTVSSPLQGVTWKTAPLQGIPLQGVPLQGVPLQGVPLQGVPLQGVPVEETTLLATAFSTVPLQGVPVVDIALLSLPLQGVPLESSPLQGITVDGNPLTFSQLPTQGVALGFNNDSISSLHIGLTEAGGPNLGAIAAEPVQPVAIGANFANQDEQLLYTVGPGVTNVFFALFPHQGPTEDNATTNARIEVWERLDRSSLPAALCEGSNLVATPSTSTESLVVDGEAMGVGLASANTLVVTDFDRALALEFDGDVAAANAFFSAMNDLYFKHPKVNAHVVNMRGDLYHTTGADSEPCNTQAQNDLAEGIREEIRALIGDSPNTPTVVEAPNAPQLKDILFLFGYDTQGPFYTLDQTVVGNEATYGLDLGVRFNTPLRAMIEGNNVTDACHGDFTPQSLAGAPLCIEDIPVARWTGDPAVILQEAGSFSAANGILLRDLTFPGNNDTDDALSCLAMGYDFFSISTILSQRATSGLTNSSRCITTSDDFADCLTEEWNGDRAREQYLGACDGCDVADLNIFNAHANYNVFAPPFEYRTGDFKNMLTVDQITDQLLGRGTISLGCHYALPVPKSYAWRGDLLFPSTETFSSKPGLTIGNTGFGVGDSDLYTLMSEGVMTETIKNWAAGLPVGAAVRQGKIDYALTREPFGVQDADAIMIWRIDGPPQWQLAETGFAAAATLPDPDGLFCTADGTASFNLLGLGGGLSPSYQIERCSLTDVISGEPLGEYWRYDGDAQGDLVLPMQPTQSPIAGRLVGGSTPHIKGVVIRDGTFVDHAPAGEIDPVFLRYQTDFTTSAQEAQPCVRTLQPVQLGSVKTLDTREGPLQAVNIQGGQFECRGYASIPDPNEEDGFREVTQGLMRIYDSADLELTGAVDPTNASLELDFVPPSFQQVDLSVDPAGQNVIATLSATDDNGIAEYAAAVFFSNVNGGPGYVQTFSTNDAGTPALPLQGPQTLVLPADTDPNDDIELLYGFYAVAMDGTVASRFNKGRKIRPIGVRIVSVFLDLTNPTELVVEIDDFDLLVSPFITIEINGDVVDLIALDPADVTVNADGTATYTTDLDLTTFADGVTITVTVEDREGAFGTATRALFACLDPIDLDSSLANFDFVSCNARVEDDSIVTVTLKTAGAITRDGQYRWLFPGLNNAQFKVWNKGKKRSSPPGVPLIDYGLVPGDDNAVFIQFDGAPLGVQQGILPTFIGETQDGVSGGAGQGFIDQIGPYPQ